MTNISDQFTALSDPTRRRLVERLSKRGMAVGELAGGVPVTRPGVSQHLQVLKKAGLVSAHRKGTRRIYTLDPRGVEAMRTYLDRMWDRALTNFKQEVERINDD